MDIKRLRNLALEILKTINTKLKTKRKTINPSFMRNIFSAKLNARVRPNDILDVRPVNLPLLETKAL